MIALGEDNRCNNRSGTSYTDRKPVPPNTPVTAGCAELLNDADAEHLGLPIELSLNGLRRKCIEERADCFELCLELGRRSERIFNSEPFVIAEHSSSVVGQEHANLFDRHRLPPLGMGRPSISASLRTAW
jgi:hypothetical protein